MTAEVRLEAPLIRTERLLLRPYRPHDFRHLLMLYESDRAAYIGGQLPPRKVWDGFMNVIGHWPLLGFGGWAVEEAATGDLVGEVALQHPPDYPETELGWLLFEGQEGKGYAREAAEAARRFALEETAIASLVLHRPGQSSLDPACRKARRQTGPGRTDPERRPVSRLPAQLA